MIEIQKIFNTKEKITEEMFACVAEELICYCNYFFMTHIKHSPIKRKFSKPLSYCDIAMNRGSYKIQYVEIVDPANFKKNRIYNLGQYGRFQLISIAKKCSKILYFK